MKQLPFVGRESEQLQFKQILQAAKSNTATNDIFTNAILIYGVGGMGKSTLCRKFLEIAKSETPEMTKVYIDWEAKTGYTYTPSELLDTIYNELKIHFSKELEPYLKAKKDYKSLQDEIDKILEKEKGIIDAAQPIATTIAATTTSNPIIGAAVSGGFNLLGKILGNVEESRLKNKWGIKDEKLLFYKNPEVALASYLTEGIDKITEKEKHKILLMLDTCEVIKHSEQWLMNHFLVPMLNKNKNVILIYSGRDNTYNQRNITINEQTILVKGFADKLTTSTPIGIDMKLFSEVDIRKYLTQRLDKEVNEKTVQFVQKLSRGVPFAVDLLANAIENIGIDSFLKNFEDEKFHSLIEISSSNEQVIKNVAERFLFYCLQSEDGKADLPKIYSIAILKEKNPEILKELWQVSNPSATLLSLQGKYSFFIGEAKLHDAVQEFIEEYVLSNETIREGIIKEIVVKALPLYQNIYIKENDKESNLKDRIEEPRWRKSTYNLLNCLSWNDPDLAAKFFINRGIELLLFDTDYAIELKIIVNKLIKNELISNRIRKQVFVFSEALSSFRWYSFSEKLYSFCEVALDEWQLEPVQKIIIQMIKGRMQFQKDDIESALKTLVPISDTSDLQKSLKEKLAEILYTIGEKFSLDKDGNFFYSEKAEKIYEKVIKLNNKKATYFHHYAVMLRMGDKPKEAIQFYLRATELNPKEEYLFKGLGFAYDDAKFYNEAIAAFQKSIEINPKYESGYNSIGNTLLNLDRYDEAITAFQKAIEINPKYELAYTNLCNLFENSGRYEEAIETYQKAFEIDNKNIESIWRKAMLYLELNQFDKAIDECEKVLKINSENSWSYIIQCMAYIGKENYNNALALIDVSLSKKTDWLGALYNNVGYCYEEIGNIEKAIEFYEKGIENGSQNSHTGIGQIFLSQGKIDDAENYLTIAIDKQKDNTNPLTSLAILYKLKQKHKESIILFEKIIESALKKPSINNQFNHVVALIGLQRFEDAGKLLKLLQTKFIISHLTVKCLMRDLELLSKVQNSSEKVKTFISESKRILDDSKR